MVVLGIVLLLFGYIFVALWFLPDRPSWSEISPEQGLKALAWILGLSGIASLLIVNFTDFEVISLLADLAPELIGISFTVLVIDWFNERREKKRIIRQLGSRSNDFALDAVRLAAESGWLADGSLTGRNFEGARLDGAYMLFANLENVNLQDATLTNANLSLANLKGANLHSANLTDASLERSNLENVIFTGAILDGVSFANSNLRNARLVATNLSGANLMFADIDGAEFYNAYLHGADIRAYWGAIKLAGAQYTLKTKWPAGFDPSAHGAVLVVPRDEE